jgi:hypothetical protein
MKFKITNKGPARTVDFLAVFAEGETREFNDTEVRAFQDMSGVPLYSSVLADEDQFDVVALSEPTDKDGEKA